MKYLSHVVSLSLVPDKCVGCGVCTQVCPHDVLMLDNKRVVIKDRDLCMECGACATNCPAEAIQVEAGVGCATAIIVGALTGSEPNCDCAKGSCCG